MSAYRKDRVKNKLRHSLRRLSEPWLAQVYSLLVAEQRCPGQEPRSRLHVFRGRQGSRRKTLTRTGLPGPCSLRGKLRSPSTFWLLSSVRAVTRAKEAFLAQSVSFDFHFQSAAKTRRSTCKTGARCELAPLHRLDAFSILNPMTVVPDGAWR